MSRKLVFIFLIMNLPLLSMNHRGRRRRKKGYGEQFGAFFSGVAGGFFGGAAKIIVDNVGEGCEENLQSILEEFLNKMHMAGEELENSIHNAGEEAHRNLKNSLDMFSKELREMRSETVEIFRKTIRETIKEDYKRVIGYPCVGAAGVVGAYFGFKALFSHITRVLQKPKVIVSSSRQGWLQWFARLIVGKNKQSISMVFPPELENRLNLLICATKQINKRIKEGKRDVKYRNILLYGSPGTGKTMFARKFSFESGMEFIEITGSSLFQKGAGIGAIDELFSWAKKNKGLCLFIDEADSLFINRETVSADSDSYRIVNHFLNYLGQRSNKFTVVMATNHHKNFDEAMHRRIDDMIKMPLPGKRERFEVLSHYRKMVLCAENDEQEYKRSVEKYVTDEKLRKIADQTKGFSYGDMHGIINKLKTDSFTTEGGLIDADLIEQVVKEYKEKFEAFKQPQKRAKDKGNDLID